MLPSLRAGQRARSERFKECEWVTHSDKITVILLASQNYYQADDADMNALVLF